MSHFQKWWDSKENPANNMPENTKTQMKWHMEQAFKAGMKVKSNGFDFNATK